MIVVAGDVHRNNFSLGLFLKIGSIIFNKNDLVPVLVSEILVSTRIRP